MKRTYLGAFLIASLLFVGTVPAFALSCKTCPGDVKIRNGSRAFSFGNSNAGAGGYYSVQVGRIGNFSSSITVSTGGTVFFLGKTAKAVGVDVTVREDERGTQGNVKLKVLNYIVDSGVQSTSFAFTKTYPVTFITASKRFTVGPVPVVIRGSLGGGGSVGFNVTVQRRSGVGLSGDTSAWGTGIASIGPGVNAINVSLIADATVLKTSFKPSLFVGRDSWSGHAQLALDPLNVDFSIKLQSNLRNKSYQWYQYVFARYSQPSKSVTTLQL